MSSLRPPAFLSDLYRDLRDRRLLLPAAALVIALVAVPVLIGSGGEEAIPPPPPSPVAAGDATEVSAAVLAEEAGVRDYRRRLEALKSQNPFEQKFAAPTPESVGLQEPATSASTGSASGATTGLSGAPSSAADTTSTATDEVNVSPSAGTDAAVEPADDEPVQPATVVEERFYSFRIKVAIGPLGEVKKLDDVRELDFLPGAKDPVVAFLGVDERGTKATFVLDADVVGSRGDGRCLGGGEAGTCQFLVLKPGEQRIFDFGPGVPAQRLKLLDVRTVEVSGPKSNRDG